MKDTSAPYRQKALISAQAQDERILQEVNRLLETGADEDTYQLTPEQTAGIEESREQIKNGQYLTNEEANKEIQGWLKNK